MFTVTQIVSIPGGDSKEAHNETAEQSAESNNNEKKEDSIVQTVDLNSIIANKDVHSLLSIVNARPELEVRCLIRTCSCAYLNIVQLESHTLDAISLCRDTAMIQAIIPICSSQVTKE